MLLLGLMMGMAAGLLVSAGVVIFRAMQLYRRGMREEQRWEQAMEDARKRDEPTCKQCRRLARCGYHRPINCGGEIMRWCNFRMAYVHGDDVREARQCPKYLPEDVKPMTPQEGGGDGV